MTVTPQTLSGAMSAAEQIGEPSANDAGKADAAGATDATVAKSTNSPTLLGAVLGQMEPEIQQLLKGKEKPKDEKIVEADIPMEVPEVEEPKPEAKPELEAEPEPKPTAEKDSEEEKVQEPQESKFPDHWPDDAKKHAAMLQKRASDDYRKRKTRTEERNRAYEVRDRLTQENEQLKQQLKTAQRPAPSPSMPLADVHDESSLSNAEKQYETLLEFAENNRDGAMDVVVGKDAKGNEQKRDFTPEEITKMKLSAERALRRDIPQRRQYLAARNQWDDAVYKIYPDMKDETSQMRVMANQFLQYIPELERTPDVLYWIGNALAKHSELVQLQQNGQNGDKKLSPEARKVVEASKIPKAPATVKPSGSVERGKVDIETARKNLTEGGGSEQAMQAFIDAKLRGSRSGAKEVVQT